MSRIEMQDIMDEFMYFLRNNITDPNSRPRQTDEYFSGDDATKAFTLHQANIKNIRTVEVGGTTQSYGTDYSVSLDTKMDTSTVTFTSAPASGTDNIKITYNFGPTWIYDKYPDEDIQIASFPRISFGLLSMVTRQLGIGNSGDMSNPIISVTVDARNPKEVYDLISDIRNAVASNKQNFYNFSHIMPVSVSPIIPTPGPGKIPDKIKRGVVDFEIPFIWETTS